jgi:hypothetical protein
VSELAELLEWAFSSVEEMFAHLGLELLLESIKLTLISVEIVIVGLLSEVSQDLAWWVVEVSWSSLGVNALTLVSRLQAALAGLTRATALVGITFGRGAILVVFVFLGSCWHLDIFVATDILEIVVSWHFVLDNL